MYKVRIEYAGSATNREEPSALLLASVGTGTTIDHVQVTESAADGIYLLGGTVNMQYLLSLNSYKSGFHFSLGNVSKAQFLLDLRKDVAAHVSSGSYGMFIENDLNGSTNTPITQPLISNFTGRGPGYCTLPVSTDFHDGIRFDNNGAGNIRNSAIDGWPDNGLFINDALSIGNTANNDLNFSSNAVVAVSAGSLYAAGASWATGCSSSMTDWIEEQTVSGCEEPDNDFSLTDFGYNADLCDDYCDTRPTLTRSGTALDGTDFSAPFNTFFSNVNYKGALDSTDWTLSWANFCPQTATYCSCNAPLLKTSKASIRFVPNPSTGTTVAYFETNVTGKAELSVLDNITDALLRSKSIRVEHSGKQQISFSVKGLREGIYPVRIEMRDAIFTGQIVVR